MSSTPPVIAIVVYKRNPLVTLGRPQKYRWVAKNWANRRKLATSGESFTNREDALRNAVQLFADSTVDQQLVTQAGYTGDFVPSNVSLIQDGVSGMQTLRLHPQAA